MSQILVCCLATIIIVVVSIVVDAKPLDEKHITVTICEDPLCRQKCKNETGMPQNQCRNEGHRGSQKAMCFPPPGSGHFCVQQTIFGEEGPHNNAASSSNNNNKNHVPCDPHRALATAPRECDQCIDNREHAHGHVELEFIKVTGCNSKNGSFTVHTECTPSCNFCNSKFEVEPKKCYANEERGFDTLFSAVAPCPDRLIVQDFYFENCTGLPDHLQTTFQNRCYTQQQHRGRDQHHGQTYSLMYNCQ